MKPRLSATLPLAIFLVLFWLACDKSDDTPDNPDYLAQADCSGITTSANTYSNSIKAILDTNCAFGGCHDAATAQNGVVLDNYNGARAAFRDNVGLCAIHHGSGCEHMPDNAMKLPDATIQKIDCWAKNGYAQ